MTPQHEQDLPAAPGPGLTDEQAQVVVREALGHDYALTAFPVRPVLWSHKLIAGHAYAAGYAAAQASAPQVPRGLRYLLHQIDDATTVSGYGFYRPYDPHNFSPDHESCTVEEIAAHKAACEAFGKPDYKPPQGSEWIGEGETKIHILRAPWGIGSYSEQDTEIRKLLDAAFALIDAAPPAASARGEAERQCGHCGHKCSDPEWLKDGQMTTPAPTVGSPAAEEKK